MIYHIQIIGEAASKLTVIFQKAHSQVPWSQIITMRHVLVHDYLGIDLGEVWAVVERDLPVLKKQLRQMVRPRPNVHQRANPTISFSFQIRHSFSREGVISHRERGKLRPGR